MGRGAAERPKGRKGTEGGWELNGKEIVGHKCDG